MQRGLRRLAQQRAAPLLWSLRSPRPNSSFALCCPSLSLRDPAAALARAAAARASTGIAVRTAATTTATAPPGGKHLSASSDAEKSTTASAGSSSPDGVGDPAPAGSSSNNNNSNSSSSPKVADLGESGSSSVDAVSSSGRGEASSSNRRSTESSSSDNSSTENISSNGSSGTENSSTDDGGRQWSFRWTWPRGIAAVSATSLAVWLGYEFVESGFSLGKTEWTMTRKIKRFFLGKPVPSRAAVDSKFQLGLPEEIQNELAVYFIQLDLDKPNGVRRSDALALAETLGFDTKNKICGAFVQKGKGRAIDERRTAGCSLQELGELIEALVLHEEANPDGHQQQPQQQQQHEQLQQGRLPEEGAKVQQEQQSNAEDLREETTTDAPAVESESLPTGAPSSSSLSREKPQERVLRLLKEANEQAKPTAWTAPRVSVRHLSQAMAQQQQQQQQHSSGLISAEQNQEEERRALELRLAVITRTLGDLDTLSKRRGRTEAERERQKGLEMERKMIQAQLRELEYS